MASKKRTLTDMMKEKDERIKTKKARNQRNKASEDGALHVPMDETGDASWEASEWGFVKQDLASHASVIALRGADVDIEATVKATANKSSGSHTPYDVEVNDEILAMFVRDDESDESASGGESDVAATTLVTKDTAFAPKSCAPGAGISANDSKRLALIRTVSALWNDDIIELLHRKLLPKRFVAGRYQTKPVMEWPPKLCVNLRRIVALCTPTELNNWLMSEIKARWQRDKVSKRNQRADHVQVQDIVSAVKINMLEVPVHPKSGRSSKLEVAHR